jgi:hypothetical protein
LFFDPDKVVPQHGNGDAIATRDNLLHPSSGSQKVMMMEARSLICCRNRYPRLGGLHQSVIIYSSRFTVVPYPTLAQFLCWLRSGRRVIDGRAFRTM